MQVQWPPFTKSVIAITIGLFLFWLLSAIIPEVGNVAATHFSLSLEGVKANRLYTVLTYGLWHRSFMEVLFTALAIWLFGGELEQAYGKKTWWGMLVAATILGGLFYLVFDFAVPEQHDGSLLGLFNQPGISGMHAGVMAFVTAFCAKSWTRPLNFFFVPMTGKTMLLFFLGLSIVMSIFGGHYGRLTLDAAGVLVGFAVAKRWINIRDLRTRFAIWKARRHLKVVKTPESKPNGKMNGKSNGVHKNGKEWLN